MDAIHELMGGTGQVGGNEARQHVNKVFDMMDLDQDGMISIDEFLAYCTTHQDVAQSLTVFTFFHGYALCCISICFYLNQFM